MTGDPLRLCDPANDTSPLVRDLVESLHEVAPSPQAKAEAWKRIAAVTVAMTAGSGAVAKTAGLGARASLYKIALTCALAGTSASAVGLALAHRMAAKVAPRSQRTLAVGQEDRAPLAAPSDDDVPRTLPVESLSVARVDPPAVSGEAHRALPPKPATRPPAQDVDPLASEIALITQARARLRQGDATGAQSVIDELRAKYPDGVLTQEREIVEIDLLRVLGHREEARRRARAFVDQYPHSPHNVSLRPLLDQSP
jgi:hypothetical protein